MRPTLRILDDAQHELVLEEALRILPRSASGSRGRACANALAVDREARATISAGMAGDAELPASR